MFIFYEGSNLFYFVRSSLFCASIVHCYTGYLMSSQWSLFKNPWLHHLHYESLFNSRWKLWHYVRYICNCHPSHTITSLGGWAVVYFINSFKKKRKKRTVQKRKLNFGIGRAGICFKLPWLVCPVAFAQRDVTMARQDADFTVFWVHHFRRKVRLFLNKTTERTATTDSNLLFSTIVL
jgi:hypothetical protein